MNLIDIAVAGYKPTPMELRAFSTSVENTRNQCDVVTGPTFQGIEIVSNITDPTKLLKIQAELNGQMIVDVTGSDLKMIEAYSKRTRAAGRYYIPFSKTEARTLEGMRLGELVTLPSDALTLYVTVGDNGGAPVTLRARAMVTPSQPVRYFIPKLDAVTFTAPQDGENLFAWSVRNAGLFIRRLHFQSADIERLQVYRDDLRVFNASKDDNNADLSEGGDNAPQADTYHYDPAHTGFHLQGLFPTIARKELAFKYDMAAAGSVRVLRETIEQVKSMQQAA